MKKNLTTRFKEEFLRLKFSPLEIMGFKTRYDLAMIAGMAVGYRLCLEDFSDKIEGFEKKIESLERVSAGPKKDDTVH